MTEAHGWRATPVSFIAVAAAIALAGIGLLFSRPDVIALSLPLALGAIVAALRRARNDRAERER